MQLYVSASSLLYAATRDVVLEHMTNGLVAALASAQPRLYNRPKWTGSDLAVDDLGIFEAAHRLLSTTYCRFCATFLNPTKASQLLKVAERLATYDPPPLRTVEDGDPADVVADDAGDAGASATYGETAKFVKENAKNRSLGLAFVQEGALPCLILMRILMEPMRQYMADQLRLASHTYDTSYIILELSLGDDDARFFTRVAAMMCHKELWSVVPPSWNTFAKRSLAFRLVSRMGCAFECLHVFRHRSFPTQLFRLLGEPTAAAATFAVPDCMLDGWSTSMRSRFHNLDNPELLHILHTLAVQMPVDITHIEPLHASARRFLLARSTTHPMSLGDLSAQCACQQSRAKMGWRKTKRNVGLANRNGGHVRKGNKVHVKSKRGCGGAWRA